MSKLLENFDQQKDLKKRDIIQLIIPKAIVKKDNKLELWIRKDLEKYGDKIGTARHPIDSESNKCNASSARHEVSSYPSSMGLEQNENLKFFENSKTGFFGKSEVSHRKNGGVEGTRTLGLPRDRRTL